MTAVLDRPKSDTIPGVDVRLPTGRTRAPGRPWKRIAIDSALLVTFILSFASLALGNTLWHVAAGAAFAIIAVLHTGLNWRWARTVARRRRALRGKARANAIVASILAFGWVAIVVSGIAQWAGASTPFHQLHSAGVFVLTGSTVVHLVQHRRWIKRAVRG